MGVFPKTKGGPKPSPAKRIENAVADILDALNDGRAEVDHIALDLDDCEVVRQIQRRAETEERLHAIAADAQTSAADVLKASSEARLCGQFVTTQLVALRVRLHAQANPRESRWGGTRPGAGRPGSAR